MIVTYDLVKQRDFGSFISDGEEYIIINEKPYFDSRYKGHNKQEFYRAAAIRLGDDIDNDGYATAYNVKWHYPNRIENLNDVCDWNHPDEITVNGSTKIL